VDPVPQGFCVGDLNAPLWALRRKGAPGHTWQCRPLDLNFDSAPDTEANIYTNADLGSKIAPPPFVPLCRHCPSRTAWYPDSWCRNHEGCNQPSVAQYAGFLRPGSHHRPSDCITTGL